MVYSFLLGGLGKRNLHPYLEVEYIFLNLAKPIMQEAVVLEITVFGPIITQPYREKINKGKKGKVNLKMCHTYFIM